MSYTRAKIDKWPSPRVAALGSTLTPTGILGSDLQLHWFRWENGALVEVARGTTSYTPAVPGWYYCRVQNRQPAEDQSPSPHGSWYDEESRTFGPYEPRVCGGPSTITAGINVT